MKNVINGAKINTLNIARIERILAQAKLKCKEAATEEYNRLLSLQVSRVVDDIALNIMQRPADKTILDIAIQLVNDNCLRAENFGLLTENNLTANATLIPDKEENCCFLLYNIPNPVITSAFLSTKEIEDYSVPEASPALEAANVPNVKTQVWERLQKSNNNETLLWVRLTSRVEPNPAILRFESVKERAAERARHSVTNELLSLCSGGQEIKQQDLMRYMDQSLMMLSEYEGVIAEKTQQLLRILPEITLEIISNGQGCDN